MLNRRMSEGRVMRWTSRHGSGRGPTSDMSPRSTFQSCGSSSIDDLRSSRPSGVIRGSFRILNTGPLASLRVLERRLELVGVGEHRPELVHPERPLAEAAPVLRVDDRTAARQLDRDRRRSASAARRRRRPTAAPTISIARLTTSR